MMEILRHPVVVSALLVGLIGLMSVLSRYSESRRAMSSQERS